MPPTRYWFPALLVATVCSFHRREHQTPGML
jgi:hypothetical protein